MAEDKYNLKNPSVKRILQEMKEMQNNPSDDYISMPLEDNIFEWQFAIRGPRDTEFEGGIYHGRIQLPPEYPFKPPSFMLLTPNGRFETQTKICLSISQYHPEHWQPSWSVRTALVALIAFMPTKGNGAIGSLEFTKEERRALAIKSQEAPPKYGNEVRQALINEVHEQMLARSCKGGEPVTTSEEKVEEPKDPVLPLSDAISDVIDFEPAASNIGEAGFTVVPENEGGEQQVMEHRVQEVFVQEVQTHTVENARDALRQEVVVVARQPPPSDDWGLTLLAIGLSVALIALLIKKIFKSQWGWVNI